VFDGGYYERCLRMAAEAVGYDRHVAEGRGPDADGRYRGIGFSSYVERTGYASAKFLAGRGSRFGAHESVTLRANRSGGIDLYTGVSSIGQGSETIFAQLCSQFFGVPYDAVSVHAGDTGTSPLNTGSFASRTAIAAAGAIREACEQLLAKTLQIAGHILEADDPAALAVLGRDVALCGDPAVSVPLSTVFTRAIQGQGLPEGMAPGLEATSHFEAEGAAYSFGTAAVTLNVDAETGEFEIGRLVMVHDCGTPINPKLIEGQVLGGLTQGLGQALGEELRYDPESGQLVNGTMMDYFAPTICDVPTIELQHTAIPAPFTPLGIRGAGEVGCIPAAAAVANAICDALFDFGVEIDRLPITPERVWEAIRSGRDLCS